MKSATHLLRLATLLAAGLVACAAEVGEPLGASSAPIVGGELDTGDPAVVEIASANCSGTLVAPRAILTAAHCDVAPGAAVAFSDGTTLAALSFHAHPSWDPITASNDIAVVLLAAPSSVPPVPLSTSPITDALVGARVRIVGYGETGDGGAAGTKHMGFTTIAGYDATTFTDAAQPAASCVGDSGGPALVTVGGVESVAGVTSRGDLACASFGVKTRVDAYVAGFLAPLLAGDAPVPGAPGAPCEADGDCAGDLCAARTFGGARTCAVLCEPTAATPCASGFVCAAGEDAGAAMCFPEQAASPATRGASCAMARSARTGSDVPASFLAGALLFLQAARRRRTRSAALPRAHSPFAACRTTPRKTAAPAGSFASSR